MSPTVTHRNKHGLAKYAKRIKKMECTIVLL